MALLPVKACYYLTAFEQAIVESEDIEELTEAQQIERSVFVTRSQVALGKYDAVVSITDSQHPALVAVKKTAEFLSGGEQQKAQTVAAVKVREGAMT